VTRFATPAVVLLVGLMLAAPAGAQNADPPTELWSEYPLVPKVGQAVPSPVGPFRPPGGVESQLSDDSSGSGYWLPLLAFLAIALLVATRFARPLATTGTDVLGARVAALRGRARDLRPRPTRRPKAPSAGKAGPGRSHVQYAPTSAPPDQIGVLVPPRSVPMDAPGSSEAVPYVTRRSGIVRSRYVVVKRDAKRPLRRSRAFWRLGGADAQRRKAEAAWDDLANDLRADGWELDTAGRFEYYVPLRRALVSTLEPYTQVGPPDSAEGRAE
jgi:hypothetical protein